MEKLCQLCNEPICKNPKIIIHGNTKKCPKCYFLEKKLLSKTNYQKRKWDRLKKEVINN